MATEIRGATIVSVAVTAPVTPKQTALVVASATGWEAPAAGEFVRAVLYDSAEDDRGGPFEVVHITAINGTTFTVKRGMEGTRPQPIHANAALRTAPTDAADTGGAGAAALGDLTDVDLTGAGDGDVLTYDSGSGDWVAAAPAAGSGLLHQATVELTNAQIKALPTTGITVVAAAGANKVVLPVSAHVITTLAAAYTGLEAGPATLVLTWHQDGSTQASAELQGLGVLSFSRFAAFLMPQSVADDTGDYGTSAYTTFIAGTPPTNLPLLIKDTWNGSDYTDGDAANTMRVSVTYLVLDTTTGVFE